MYRACIYCHRDLGKNEVVEHFPIGRRLAFDSIKGRLWVVCARCRRWNLSPLEERWEAIEECERCFQSTPTRFSSENIGLAKLREGLGLVRVGEPNRQEFAAWRYGRTFPMRRLSNIMQYGALAGAVAIARFVYLGLPRSLFVLNYQKRVVARIRTPDGQLHPVIWDDLKHLRVVPSLTPDRWVLQVTCRPRVERSFWGRSIELAGSDAITAAGLILPRVNSLGGAARKVYDAVTLIEDAGGPLELFPRVAMLGGKAGQVKKMRPAIRLALEMAAHEESERRALEGELAELEAAWREAEEIAAIADRLLIPASIDRWLERQQRG